MRAKVGVADGFSCATVEPRKDVAPSSLGFSNSACVFFRKIMGRFGRIVKVFFFSSSESFRLVASFPNASSVRERERALRRARSVATTGRASPLSIERETHTL